MYRLTLLMIISISLLYTGIASGEEKYSLLEGVKSFTDLKVIRLNNEDVNLYYDPKKSEVLKAKHPEADDYDQGGISISRPLRTQLLGIGKGYFTIDCDSGGSADPNCTILQETNGKLKEVARIPGLSFAFPGNGYIYVEGHTNNMFNFRQKYEWKSGIFSPVKQPFNFVGLNTTTREVIDLYQTQEYKQSVATLPKGSSILVVINDGEHFLVKSPFGLLGWVKIHYGVQQSESPIHGIYYAGD